MADFYEEMAAVAAEMLSPTSQGGLGQGVVELSRSVQNPVDPLQPWIDPGETVQKETLKAGVFGIGKELIGAEVGGTVLLASDRYAICAPPKMQYTAGDTLVVDGSPVHILSYKKIPAAGTPSAVRFIIRG